MYGENKQKFEQAMSEFKEMKADKRKAVVEEWTLRLQFEIYGELSSLSHSYKKMLEIVQAKEQKKA